MSDVLRGIFTDEIVGKLQKCGATLPSAEFGYRVLSLPPAQNSGPGLAASDQQLYQQTRERWNRWIANAVSVGLFEEPHGAELKSRLTGIDHNGFRSALAECMTCWALSSELGLQVQPRPSGRGGCVLEFAVQTSQGDISFEVKSPRLRGSAHCGPQPEESAAAMNIYSAALAMRAALRSANRQFARARRNILVIALPEIEKGPAAMLCPKWPAALIRALYGEQRAIAAPSGPSANQFVAEGNFLKQAGGVPRFTRISAVIRLEDCCGHPQLRAAVLHNPCSQEPVDSSFFGEWRQFGAVDGEICCFRPPAPAKEVVYSL
jgi:hypothetical protein